MDKNNCCISFPITKLALPGFPRLYRVAATCNHSGNLLGGHWLTKAYTTRGWYALDDLKPTCLLTRPPGFKDSSVTVILLIAEDKLLC